MMDLINKLNFISLILNIPFLLISIYITFYFYTYKNIKDKKNSIYDIAPVSFTVYLSLLLIIFLQIIIDDISSYGNLIWNWSILIVILSAIIINILLDLAFVGFIKMKSILRIFIVANIFLFGLLISDSSILNSVFMFFIMILLIITVLHYSSDYGIYKDKSMRVTFASFFSLFPLIFSILILNMNTINFELSHYNINNNVNEKYIIISIQILLLLWNMVVIIFKGFNINIYTVIKELIKLR
ncbi:hypothetical protein CPT_Machias_008 [Staphylococcus phage Machias]|nr:hypothetical protein CPT_Machias_008 [Staphylococcus phage Machias]